MRKIFVGMLVTIAVASSAYAVFAMHRASAEVLSGHQNLEKRIHVIVGIRPQLMSLTDSIWRAISAYDPKSRQKVGFATNVYNDSFGRWDKEVERVKQETSNQESRRRLDVLQRSLRVLSKRVDALDDDSIKKILSDDIFSDDSETTAKDVYTDRMQKKMGQIRVSVGVINTAISEYIESTTGEFSACNRVAESAVAKCDGDVRRILTILAILFLFSAAGIISIKEK